MELKDVILSTLAEMEDNEATKKSLNSAANFEVKETLKVQTDKESKKQTLSDNSQTNVVNQNVSTSNSENEMIFLSSIRERLLVLFEGFQAPNNTNIEAKVDLTLNFLEYVLVTIDDRIEKLEKGDRK